MVRNERATWAAFHPLGTKHEVIHNQLASTAEKIAQRFLALRPIENVSLLNLLPRQFAALPAQLVAQPRKLLLLLQQLLSRRKPFRLGHDSGKRFFACCHDKFSSHLSFQLDFRGTRQSDFRPRGARKSTALEPPASAGTRRAARDDGSYDS